MTVSALIRAAREAKGLSQEGLAREAHLSSSTVIRVEGGKLAPLAETLFRLAKALDIPLDQLSEAVLFGDDDESAPDFPEAESKQVALARELGVPVTATT